MTNGIGHADPRRHVGREPDAELLLVRHLGQHEHLGRRDHAERHEHHGWRRRGHVPRRSLGRVHHERHAVDQRQRRSTSRTSTLTIGSSSVDTLANAQTALASIDVAIGKVNSALGVIGAGQNRLTNAIGNLSSTVQNYQAAEGTIKDVDMASEMVSFSKNQILAQAGTAMLAQANQSGSSVLKLLQ